MKKNIYIYLLNQPSVLKQNFSYSGNVHIIKPLKFDIKIQLRRDEKCLM